MNDMRNRLVDLLDADITHTEADNASAMADYLIKNGVILPPCKLGDTAYTVGAFTGTICKFKVTGITITKEDVILQLDKAIYASMKHHIGKTVFVGKNAKNKAEKALSTFEGGKDNG